MISQITYRGVKIDVEKDKETGGWIATIGLDPVTTRKHNCYGDLQGVAYGVVDRAMDKDLNQEKTRKPRQKK